MLKTPKEEAVTPENLRRALGDSADLTERTVLLGGQEGKTVTLFFLDGLVSGDGVSETVLRPLTDPVRFPPSLSLAAAGRLMAGGLVYGLAGRARSSLSETVTDLLAGRAAVLTGGAAVTFEARSPEKRSVQEPTEEKAVKGPKDAFTETLRTNTGLVRRRLATPSLRIREFSVGGSAPVTVSLFYLEGFTDPKLVEEAQKRVQSLRTESLLSAAALAENLTDAPRSPFPQLLTTERPDRFARNLLEGRVGLLADGLPLGFLAPATLVQFFKVPEDNASHFLAASWLTLMRFFAFTLALTAPAVYTAVAMYHQEMIPLRLMQSVIDAKRSVPFPTALEVLAMLAAFELLQEAGARLPAAIGQSVSIIGALVVGQSAVEAKVVSPVVVVVIALSGIAGFTVPDQDLAAALRLCRFLLVAAAALMGLVGVSLGLFLLAVHLASLDSFGVPYLSPLAGAEGKYLLRALLRLPLDIKRDRDPTLGPR